MVKEFLAYSFLKILTNRIVANKKAFRTIIHLNKKKLIKYAIQYAISFLFYHKYQTNILSFISMKLLLKEICICLLEMHKTINADYPYSCIISESYSLAAKVLDSFMRCLDL